MRFFKRSEPEQDVDFWTWWAGARNRIEQAIETGALDRKLVDEISRAVERLDSRLAWELSKGDTSKHALTVTPEGNARSRPAAVAWLASAPSADATWQFFASRQPSRSTQGVFEVGGEHVAVADVRAITSWDATRRRIDIRLWHPVFEHAPAALRQQVCFLFLDDLLGEEDVERWIGKIDILDVPTGGRTPDELRTEVRRRAAEPAGATWVVGERADHLGQVEVVMANAGLKRIDLPFADQHVAISIAIDGAPDAGLAEQLEDAQSQLVERFGAAATLAGRTTGAFARVVHFVAEDPRVVREAIDGWALTLPPWRIKVAVEHDPTWEFQHTLGVR